MFGDETSWESVSGSEGAGRLFDLTTVDVMQGEGVIMVSWQGLLAVKSPACDIVDMRYLHRRFEMQHVGIVLESVIHGAY